MIYLLWMLPALVVAAAIASGRFTTTRAAMLGVALTAAIALLSAPQGFGLGQLSLALARGMWIGAVIAPYILGGLLFWHVAGKPAAAMPHASRPRTATIAPAHTTALADDPKAQRRWLFFACFLVGPFAESATGFGVGLVGTMAMLKPLGLAPQQWVVFGLMSQTLIPWGGMGSGTLLAAAYARMPAHELALYSLPPVCLLMAVWLTLYWRTARQAGLGGSLATMASELAWLGAALALLALSTWQLGPETALLAAFGPLIVLRYLLDWRPGAAALLALTRQTWPYAALIAWLMLTRLVPGLRDALLALGQWAPFEDLPTWSPLFHVGSWLLLAALALGWWRSGPTALRADLRHAWQTGRAAVWSVVLFAMMAETLAQAGIAQALAAALLAQWQAWAVLATPWIAAGFGMLSNSGNAPNSLFMPAQLALAVQAGLSVPAVVALQHVSGTSMSLLSPVRMTIAAGLAGVRGQERALYAVLLPYGLVAMVVLTALSVAVVLNVEDHREQTHSSLA